MSHVTIIPTIGNERGLIIELDNGYLIVADEQTGAVKRSIDGGVTWSTVLTLPAGLVSRGLFLASNGYILLGTIPSPPYLLYGRIYRSTDNGATFSLVNTGESSAFWYFAEQSDGTLYAPEYSAGLQDANELYAYNIWRSQDNGATWSKFISVPPQSNPGVVRDSIRHMHVLGVADNDEMYVGFGETKQTYGGYAGEVRKLESNGTIGIKIAEDGNGWTSFAKTDDGRLLFGGDTSPVKIYEIISTSYRVNIDISTIYGSDYDTVILAMCTGRHGVVYAVTQGGGGKFSYIMVSANNGDTWFPIKYSTSVNSGTQISCNKNAPSGLVYLAQSTENYVAIPDYTKQQIMDLFPSTLTIRGNES